MIENSNTAIAGYISLQRNLNDRKSCPALDGIHQ